MIRQRPDVGFENYSLKKLRNESPFATKQVRLRAHIHQLSEPKEQTILLNTERSYRLFSA